MDWEIEIGGVLTKQEQAKKKEMMDGGVGRNDGLREKLDWK